MRKLLVLLSAVILSFSTASNADWYKIENTWHKIGESGYSALPAPVGCLSTYVPFFGSTLTLGCDAGLTYTTATLAAPVHSGTSFVAAAPGTITITGASNTTPIVVTAVAHGLKTNDRISISGITGNTNANGYFRITRLTTDTFSLQNYSTGADIAGNGAYGGTPVAVTGIVQAQRVLVAPGTAAAPSIGNASFPDTGITFTGYTTQIYQNGTLSLSTGPSGLALGPGGTTVLTPPAAATLQLGAANSATGAAVAQTLQTQSNITQTDVNAPASFTIIGPRGTGTGTAGSIVFQTGVPQAAGTTAHVPATALTLTNTGTGGASVPLALLGGTLSTVSNQGAFSGNNVWLNSTGQFAFTSGGAYTNTKDTILERGAAATFQFGGANAASPVAQTLQAQGSRGGTDTDVAGANLTIRPGAGTGNAASSSVFIAAPVPTSPGTTAQTQSLIAAFSNSAALLYRNSVAGSTDSLDLGVTSLAWRTAYLSRGTLGSKTKALTDGGAVTFATFTIADAAMYSGEIIYNVKAVKGTDIQVLASKVRFTAARVGTNYYVSVSTVGTDTTSVSTGTLSCPISISGTGGVISLVATADTSFASPDSLVGQFRFDSPDAALALTFP